jgi:hypothetical protein
MNPIQACPSYSRRRAGLYERGFFGGQELAQDAPLEVPPTTTEEMLLKPTPELTNAGQTFFYLLGNIAIRGTIRGTWPWRKAS